MADKLIDLHAHTIYSDGSDGPQRLVALAQSAGASAIAITDHDTVEGLAEGRSAAERAGIEFINGIEISAEHSPGVMHILGYYIDDRSEVLATSLAALRRARSARNPRMADRLLALGMNVSYEEVVKLAGNEVVGRPHFARLIVERGYARSIQEAFDRFLAKGAAAYVEKERLSPADAISLIHKAGGVAVLAHPYQLGVSPEETGELIEELVEMGLDGIEAIYSRHSLSERSAYARIAARFDLLITGGSDYHGSYKPDIDIVTGKGDLKVPYSLLDEIKTRACGSRQSVEDN